MTEDEVVEQEMSPEDAAPFGADDDPVSIALDTTDHDDEKPDPDWVHFDLWSRVVDTVEALPDYFEIKGELPAIEATDLHAANTLLGAVIENHIPVTLNKLRHLWDTDRTYADCSFRRQPQTFPDVPLRRVVGGQVETLFGLEIKSWYLLSKEKVPSLRFHVNRNFCSPADLCIVFPWALSAGVSGSPMLFRPIMIGARKAARLRNYAWIHSAKNGQLREVLEPSGPYRTSPTREDRINDSALNDSGKNFGRIARTGIWRDDINRLLAEERISGIPLSAWVEFLSAFTETTSLEDSIKTIRRIAEAEQERKATADVKKPVPRKLAREVAQSLTDAVSKIEGISGTLNEAASEIERATRIVFGD